MSTFNIFSLTNIVQILSNVFDSKNVCETFTTKSEKKLTINIERNMRRRSNICFATNFFNVYLWEELELPTTAVFAIKQKKLRHIGTSNQGNWIQGMPCKIDTKFKKKIVLWDKANTKIIKKLKYFFFTAHFLA